MKAEEESLEAEILEVYSSVLIKCKKLRRVNYWLDFFLTKKIFLNPHFFQLQEEGDEKQKEKMGVRNRKIIGKIIYCIIYCTTKI